MDSTAKPRSARHGLRAARSAGRFSSPLAHPGDNRASAVTAPRPPHITSIVPALGDTYGHVLVHTYSGGANTSAASYTASVDGVAQSVVGSGTITRGGTDLGSLGGRCTNANAVSFAFNGDVYEVVVCSGVLAAADQDALVRYLRAEYATP